MDAARLHAARRDEQVAEQRYDRGTMPRLALGEVAVIGYSSGETRLAII
jgi:hypothetical protein